MSDARDELRRFIAERTFDEQQELTGISLMDAALSRARADVLEEAATLAKAICFCASDYVDPECNAHEVAERIRQRIHSPAPATIPVERVREVLSLTKATAQQRSKGNPDKERAAQGVYAVVDHVARDLGVDLDAKGEAKDTRQTCTCTGSCKGAEGLGAGWRCALERKP